MQPLSKYAEQTSHSLLIIGCAFIMIFSMGGAACYQLYHQRFNQEREMGEHLVRQAGEALAMWLNDQVLIARSLAGTAVVQKACENPESAIPRQTAADFLHSVHKNHPEYTLITIVPFFEDPATQIAVRVHNETRLVRNGSSLVDSIGGTSAGLGDMDFDSIRAINNGLLAYISEAKPNAIKGFPPLFMISVPIHNAKGARIGALAFGIKLKYFSMFFSDNVRVGKTGRIEVIDNRGLYISNKEHSKILNPDEQAFTKPLLVRLEQGDRYFSSPYKGVTLEYSATPLQTTVPMAHKWWLLFQRDRAELYAELLPPLGGLGFLCLTMFVIITFLTIKTNKALIRSLNEQALRKQMENYRLYTRSLLYGIALLDTRTCFSDVNPAILSLLGYAEDDLLQRPLEHFLMPQADILHMVGSVLESHRKSSMNNVAFRHKDGSCVVFDVLINPIGTDTDEWSIVLTIIPIPEKRDFEERMQAIHKASFDSYFTFNEQLELVDCGESCVALLHAKNKAELLDNFFHFSPQFQADGQESKTRAVNLLRETLEKGFVRFDWEHLTSTGERIPCEISLVRFVQKGRPSLLGCMRDLREQKKIEAALAKEQALLRSILDNIQGIISLRDTEGRYVVVNNQYTMVMGLSAEQIAGKTDDELLPPNLANLCRETDKAALQSSEPYYFERILTLPNGIQRNYLFSKEALYSSSGTLEALLSVGIDITLMKEAERQILIAKTKAEEASRSKSDFLARMSHEIRTPMNAIMGMTYLCLQTELNPQQCNYLQKIKNAAANLMGILNSILDFSKIEAGKMSTEEVPFVLQDVLDQVNNLLAEKAESKKIALHSACNPSIPQHLVGDPLHLSQVLINLVPGNI